MGSRLSSSVGSGSTDPLVLGTGTSEFKAGTTVGSGSKPGFVLGGDTGMYRMQADELRTDDFVTGSVGLRAVGYAPLSSGAGAELGYTSGAGYLAAIDRSTSTAKPLYVRGAGITFEATPGTAAVEVTSTGALKLSAAASFLTFGHASLEQTTVGAAGGAAAAPLTPTKYLKVKDSAGTTLVIPAYAAS